MGIPNRHERIILNVEYMTNGDGCSGIGSETEIPSDSSAERDVLNIFFYKDVGLM